MATIYDVAGRAGVSPKTVSRVINGDAPVSERTRAKVEAAIGELGYIPSSAARGMRSHRSGLVGLITGAISRTGEDFRVHGLPDMFLIKGVQQKIREAGKTLMIADTGNRGESIEPLIRTFIEHRVEGILYVAEYHQQVVLPDMPKSCPIVLVNCFDDKGTPSVLPDDMQGQYDLVRQIIRNGHRRIAYVTLQPNIEATRLRIAGYRRALEEAGIAFDGDLVQTGYPDHSNDSAALLAAIGNLLALRCPPTVICCGNDEMAVRVYGILRTRGIRVPEQVSVAGYDNHSAIAETLFPPLTSTELPYMKMGGQAAEMLFQAVDGGVSAAVSPLKVIGETVWRQSVLARTSS
ncbi:LacI family DNA-binding transcriptional regulator [Neisseria animalis]|uniref:LacI family DNA-binding transcriptional regulator n=1 Tax=Neisseria animalis TaxID=492 RepID=A0A5P3MR62_NEIAN|nr:LacI family DNA-binding transcriptional regulator [Neisseria animalis]QEY24083.1 LacI family DNA-binding transcriptional regulator [Neisseria animalis]ROW32651.1 LacI family DNA-binding transcriptional regulator [Neisseria animalis]VEE06238.1 Glucose-resistance amylase regulator [Neisseria animalis]